MAATVNSGTGGAQETGRGLAIQGTAFSLKNLETGFVPSITRSLRRMILGRRVVRLVPGPRNVISNPKVLPIFWGPAWQEPSNKDTSDKIITAIRTILASNYMEKLSQYGPMHPASLLDAQYEPNDTPPSGFTTDDVGNFVQRMIDNGLRAPHDDKDLLYFVFLPPNVFDADGNAGGHYNARFKKPASSVEATGRFAWILCSLMMDSITRVFSHELIETCTNPDNDGLRVEPPLIDGTKWNEICDDGCGCLNEVGFIEDPASELKVAVQKYWSEVDGRCVAPGEIVATS
jgi:hypothetical protein